MKGVRVRYFVIRADHTSPICWYKDEYQYDVTIPVALAAYLTQVPTIQQNIEGEYLFARDMLLQDGKNVDSLADINKLIYNIPKDINIDTDKDTHFTITFAIRDDFDEKRIDRFIGIEGISVHADFGDVDIHGFPYQHGIRSATYRDTSPPQELTDDVEINLPNWYLKQLGSLQGLADI